MLLHSATISPNERINRYGGKKNEIMDVTQSKDFNDHFWPYYTSMGSISPMAQPVLLNFLPALMFLWISYCCANQEKSGLAGSFTITGGMCKTDFFPQPLFFLYPWGCKPTLKNLKISCQQEEEVVVVCGGGGRHPHSWLQFGPCWNDVSLHRDVPVQRRYVNAGSA